MTNIHKLGFISIILFSVLIEILFYNDISGKITYDYSAIITFLSIISGFILSGFSLLFSSTFVSSLYKVKDKENPQITLKHRLKNYFSLSFNVSIISVIILIIYPQYIRFSYNKHSFCLEKDMLALPIILINTFLYIVLMNHICKVFVKQKIK